MKRIGLILLIVIGGLSLAFAQVKLDDTGDKYHSEEFIYFNWNNQKPLIYVFQVNTGFNGPHIVRDYRGWYSLNGRWTLFLDERYDTNVESESDLDTALDIGTNEQGHRVIDFNYKELSLTLVVEEKKTQFIPDAATGMREMTTTLHDGVLIHDGAHMQGLVIHNYKNLKGENPMKPGNKMAQYGPDYDRAYIFTGQGDVIIATNSGHFQSQKEAFVWQDKKNDATFAVDIVRTASETDSVAWLDYPVAWKVDLPTKNTSALLNSIGSYLQVGASEDPSALEMLSLSSVRGVVTHNRKNVAAAGLVMSIKE